MRATVADIDGLAVGRALAAMSVPATPFELGRLSTTSVRPSASPSLGTMRRTAVSDGPPGGTGTMMRIGLFPLNPERRTSRNTAER